ncbi:MAG: trypsin-like peptidase domain-containing protein [Planctomycetota bacterium]
MVRLTVLCGSLPVHSFAVAFLMLWMAMVNRVDADSPVSGRVGNVAPSRETPTVRAVKRASPAVVNIHGQKTVRTTAAGVMGGKPADQFRQVNGMGTGVIIDPRGYVITNYHVVEDVRDIRVTLADGETISADLVASKIRNDLAVIRLRGDGAFPTIPRGTSSDLMVGESVIAIGNAYGYLDTVTKGIISALGRNVPVNETQEYRDLIQTSAGINPGNSGGPLLNIDGEIIGINVAVRVGAQQIAFAIPIDQVIETVTLMIEGHNEQRLSTGLQADGGPRDGDGVRIAHVSASSPAAREGLKPGDRVVRVGSQTVNDRLDFALAMIEVVPGYPLQMGVVRDGQQIELAMRTSVMDNKRISQLAWSNLGLQVRPVSSAALQRINNQPKNEYNGGLIVTAVRKGSPAEAQGIAVSDVLVGLHMFETTSLADLGSILTHPDLVAGGRSKFFVVRRDQTFFGHMRVASSPSRLR